MALNFRGFKLSEYLRECILNIFSLKDFEVFLIDLLGEGIRVSVTGPHCYKHQHNPCPDEQIHVPMANSVSHNSSVLLGRIADMHGY